MEMPDFWEVCPEKHIEAEQVKEGDASGMVTTYVLLDTWDHADWFRDGMTLYTYVSEKAKNWLEKTVGQWVSFEQALIK